MTENRNSHRVTFNCLVEFETSECCLVCELVDISLQGALISGCSGTPPEAGTACKLTISLDENEEVQIIMMGTTSHKIENRLGIHCTSIDSDSMTQLRKLVEYNLEDTELLNDDLEALISRQE